MIVVDASAMVNALVGDPLPQQLIQRLATSPIHAPHLLDVEVLSALRGLALAGRLPEQRAVEAWRNFAALHIVRHDHLVTAQRVWELRHQFTSYDATYIALSEGLEASLVTCDRKLDTTGHHAVVEVYAND